MNFHDLKVLVSTQMDRMIKTGNVIFQSKASKDSMYTEYLSSFLPGDDPIKSERTEHDCNCCKSFIRAIGGALVFIDGELVSIWDIKIDNGYQNVADAMSKLVKSAGIDTIYLHDQSRVGTDKNNVALPSGEIVTYNHFHYVLPKSLVDSQGRAKRRGEASSHYNSLELALNQIQASDVEVVLDLILQNSIERGPEYKKTVETLKKLLEEYSSVSDKEQFLWNTSVKLGVFSALRNNPIGVLLTNMAKGDELDVAVNKYEKMVSGDNFKRTKTLHTPKMVEDAYAKIQDLGLEDSLPRRPARMTDLTINNVLFADNSAKVSMGVFDALKGTGKTKAPDLSKIEDVSITSFMSDILPRAESIELMVENSHVNSLMTLVAPVHANSGNLLKWDNNFSWAYNGDVTESLRDKVSAAGGRVDGAFRFSHSWNHDGKNQSLMDLHVFMPGNDKKFNGPTNDMYGTGRRVGWNNRKDEGSGGTQDVDFTERAGDRVPVENITFPNLKSMPDGRYQCAVHNWSFRGPTLSGFKAEIEFAGEVHTYDYPAALANKEWVLVATVTKSGDKFTIEHELPSATTSREVWGINTHKFVKVDTIMLSPNFWDGQTIGNKHYFFILEGCKTPDTIRGFYNEFLRDELHAERKVFEMLGAKLKAEPTDDQLSGLGFSSTRRASVICKVRGSFSRTIRINF